MAHQSDMVAVRSLDQLGNGMSQTSDDIVTSVLFSMANSDYWAVDYVLYVFGAWPGAVGRNALPGST